MANLMGVVGSKAAESGFYPTPARLVRKMLDKVNWRRVDNILEPSAGKGDLAIPAAKARAQACNRYSEDAWKKGDMDCIEIDPNLRAILKDKGLRVVHDDFLTYETMKRYSLIVMNPPFEDGVRHVLKAISLLKPEGQLIALLNAQTIKNPYTNERDLLVRTLGQDAEIEYLEGEFLRAERKTGVETAMICYRAPAVDKKESLILERLRPAHKYVEMDPEQAAALTKADFVDAIIDRYNYEVESGCKLIREYLAVQHMIADTKTTSGYGATMTLSVDGNGAANENEWVRAVRRKYWAALFASPQFVDQLTSNLRSELYNRVNELADYEFSHYNIKEIMIQMNAQVNDGVEKTIMDLFDDWTRKYHWDENAPNRHYFDGWRTNDAFAVNRKVIIPMRAYSTWSGRFEAYAVRDRLTDIEKVMNYLDGGRTPEKDLRAVLGEAEKTGETKKIDSKYFYLTFYKKGTCHIEFKNMDLLAKFNLFAARGKNWLPPSFGRKKYRDLDPEEKKTVDSFLDDKTGKKYDAIVAYADYFLSAGSDGLALPA